MAIEVEENVAVLIDRLFEEKVTWEELIKEIRIAAKVDILTAYRMAFSHSGWRRVCNHRINHDHACRKQAKHHIKSRGPNSLIALVGESFVVIE